MDVKIIPQENKDPRDALKFIIKDTMPAYVNTLRRVMTLDVPTLAIHKVLVKENTTSMFDEYIAHRIAMLPIWSDIDYIQVTENCTSCNGESGDGCPSCTAEFNLLVETDKSTDKMVVSRDLTPRDPDYYPIYDEIPIMKMGADQRLELDAIARFGRGREHAKWNPMATAGYQYYPKIVVGSLPKGMKPEEVKEICPRGVFEVNAKKLEVKEETNCNLCNLCVDKTDGGITVEGDETTIIFTAETTRVRDLDDVVLRACDIIDEKADNILATLQEALDSME